MAEPASTGSYRKLSSMLQIVKRSQIDQNELKDKSTRLLRVQTNIDEFVNGLGNRRANGMIVVRCHVLKTIIKVIGALSDDVNQACFRRSDISAVELEKLIRSDKTSDPTGVNYAGFFLDNLKDICLLVDNKRDVSAAIGWHTSRYSKLIKHLDNNLTLVVKSHVPQKANFGTNQRNRWLRRLVFRSLNAQDSML